MPASIPSLVNVESSATEPTSLDEGEPAARTPIISSREAYLKKIGLTFDPFQTPVAEQEIGLAAPFDEHKPTNDLRLPFFRFFSQPSTDPFRGPHILNALAQPGTAFIYGRPGMGKTTLRLALTAHIRTTPENTLIVSYPLSENWSQPPTATQHWGCLAEALAIDLFVQVIEQFNPRRHTPSACQLQALKAIVRRGGGHLRRLIQKILEAPIATGLETWWPMVGRPSVFPVRRNEALAQLVQAIQFAASDERAPKGMSPLLAGLAAARRWGYQKMIVVVDGVDTRFRQVPDMLALLEPLRVHLSLWESHQVYFKFFLPEELQSIMEQADFPHLHFAPIHAKIRWNHEALRNLLADRFRAAGSRRLGFGDLAGPELGAMLDDLLLNSAEGSPRRLLQLVGQLLNHHIAHHAVDDIFLTVSDWQRLRATWPYEPPLPIAFESARQKR
jgi:hypothetical protein